MMEKLKAQIEKADNGPKEAGKFLLKICEREPAAAEIVEQDLENPDMGIDKCFLKMKETASEKVEAGCYCMTDEEAEAIIREFYGIQGTKATEAGTEKAGAHAGPSSGILDLADLLDL